MCVGVSNLSNDTSDGNAQLYRVRYGVVSCSVAASLQTERPKGRGLHCVYMEVTLSRYQASRTVYTILLRAEGCIYIPRVW